MITLDFRCSGGIEWVEPTEQDAIEQILKLFPESLVELRWEPFPGGKRRMIWESIRSMEIPVGQMVR